MHDAKWTYSYYTRFDVLTAWDMPYNTQTQFSYKNANVEQVPRLSIIRKHMLNYVNIKDSKIGISFGFVPYLQQSFLNVSVFFGKLPNK